MNLLDPPWGEEAAAASTGTLRMTHPIRRAALNLIRDGGTCLGTDTRIALAVVHFGGAY